MDTAFKRRAIAAATLAVLLPSVANAVAHLIWNSPAPYLAAMGRFGLLLALGLLVLGTLRFGDPRLLLSPLLLLGGWAATFFVLLPALFLALFDDRGSDISAYLMPLHIEMARAYHGGPAEALVMAFVALELGAHAGIILAYPHLVAVPSGAAVDASLDWRWKCRLTAILILAAALVLLQTAFLAGWLEGLKGELLRHIGDGVNPVAALALTAAFYAYARVGRAARPWMAAAILIALCASVTMLSIKIMLVSLVTALLLAFALRQASRQAILTLAAVALLAGMLMIVVITNIRSVRPPDTSFADTVAAVQSQIDREPASYLLLKPLVSKFWIRQAWTAGCLQAVFGRHFYDNPGTVSTWYFLDGLAPRYFFPNKLNLSMGTLYAVEYCGMSGPDDINPRSPHSASITVLGEPIIYGGWRTLAVAVTFLTAVCGGLTLLLLRSGDGTLILTCALLPWICDFELSFGLYVAISAKTAIYMGALLLAVPSICAFACRMRGIRPGPAPPDGRKPISSLRRQCWWPNG